MTQLKTTGFRFTAVELHPNGNATGYAVHQYQAPTGDRALMYVAYDLQKAMSQPTGYSIVAR